MTIIVGPTITAYVAILAHPLPSPFKRCCLLLLSRLLQVAQALQHTNCCVYHVGQDLGHNRQMATFLELRSYSSPTRFLMHTNGLVVTASSCYRVHSDPYDGDVVADLLVRVAVRWEGLYDNHGLLRDSSCHLLTRFSCGRLARVFNIAPLSTEVVEMVISSSGIEGINHGVVNDCLILRFDSLCLNANEVPSCPDAAYMMWAAPQHECHQFANFPAEQE